jgi:hypothetical protein
MDATHSPDRGFNPFAPFEALLLFRGSRGHIGTPFQPWNAAAAGAGNPVVRGRGRTSLDDTPR